MKYIYLFYFTPFLIWIPSLKSFLHNVPVIDFHFRLYAKPKNNTRDDMQNSLIAGFDGRYTSCIPPNELASIKKHIHQLYILRLLQDNTVNIYIKIQILNQYNEPKHTTNLNAGDLFKDWDFKF